MKDGVSRTGMRITTILVTMVVGVVAVILCCCIFLFLDRYRSAMVQSARTSTAQAVSQVSNMVGSYLQDMDQAMSMVESALLEHPAVVECAITGAPDPIRGQVVKATIVLAKGYTGTPELTRELQNHVKHATAPYKYPRVIEYVDELPKTIGGKIKRAEIRRANEG